MSSAAGSPGVREPRRALLLYCYGVFELNLFLRLRQGLGARGWTLVILTHLPSIRWRAERAGLDVVLLQAVRENSYAPDYDLMKTPEGLSGDLSSIQAQRFVRSVWEALERARQAHAIGAIAILNGARLAGQIAWAFAQTHRISTLFFELGNIDRKLFVDPEGVNAAARLARHPEMLDRYEMSPDEREAWREAFLLRRRQVNTVPQARRFVGVNPWLLIDRVAAPLMNIPQGLNLSLLRRLKLKISTWLQRDEPSLKPTGPYVFLPLQVSFDSNLLLHSDYDNLAAIDVAARRAEELGVGLVVKPHPAELDREALRRVVSRGRSLGALVTSYNTTELVLGAVEVVTINSTVGLEARLMGKPVLILGRSLYERFSDAQAIVYCAHHLVDVSPFGNEPAPVEAVDQILGFVGEHGYNEAGAQGR